jgi:hypothetical protein
MIERSGTIKGGEFLRNIQENEKKNAINRFSYVFISWLHGLSVCSSEATCQNISAPWSMNSWPPWLPATFPPWYKWFRLPDAGLFVCVTAPNCSSRWTVSINEVLVRSPDHTDSFFPTCSASVHIYLELSDDPLRNDQYDHKSACSTDNHRPDALNWRLTGNYMWHVIWGKKLDVFFPTECTYLVPTFNLIKTKRRPLHLKAQSVPRSKHFLSRLYKPIKFWCKWHKSLFVLRQIQNT